MAALKYSDTSFDSLFGTVSKCFQAATINELHGQFNLNIFWISSS